MCVCFISACILYVASIIRPPRSVTVCKGSDVTLDCGYDDSTTPVTWIINGTSFDEAATIRSPLYKHNRRRLPQFYSFTAFSINYTATFQCKVKSNPEVTSTAARVTLATGRVFCEYNYYSIIAINMYVVCFSPYAYNCMF